MVSLSTQYMWSASHLIFARFWPRTEVAKPYHSHAPMPRLIGLAMSRPAASRTAAFKLPA